jgi:hypothetical protein
MKPEYDAQLQRLLLYLIIRRIDKNTASHGGEDFLIRQRGHTLYCNS